MINVSVAVYRRWFWAIRHVRRLTAHSLSVSLMFRSVLLQRGRMIRLTNQPISCRCSTVDILPIRWRQPSTCSHFSWHLKGYSADSSIRGYLSPAAWIAFSTSELFTDFLPQTIVCPGAVGQERCDFNGVCYFVTCKSIPQFQSLMLWWPPNYKSHENTSCWMCIRQATLCQ